MQQVNGYKQCPDCKKEGIGHLPISEFNVSKDTSDGLTIYCKNHIHIRYLRDRERHPARQEIWNLKHPRYQRNWLRNHLGKSTIYSNAQAKRNPKQHQAIEKIDHLFRYYKQQNELCALCGFNEGKHKHHFNYDLPYCVYFFCKDCHSVVHKVMRGHLNIENNDVYSYIQIMVLKSGKDLNT